MGNSSIQVPPDSTGKLVDTTDLNVGGQTVQRQRIILGDNVGTATFATVLSSGPAGTEGGLVVRNIPSGTQAVSGAVSVGGQVSLGPGTANIGTINNISQTVAVTGNVFLQASTANFGTLNNISATVVVGLSYVIEKTTNNQVQVGDSANSALRVNVVAGSAGGPSSNDNTTYSTGATATAPAGFIHFSASATTMTDGRVGAARITAQRGVHVNLRTDTGTAMDDVTNNALRVSIVSDLSGTSLVARGPTAIMSASHGPKNVIASTSANVTLVASPGAGAAVFVTSLAVSNTTGTPTMARIGTSASVNTIAMFMAANGGGFVLQFDPPWELSASEACLCSVKPNGTESRFNINFYVGAPV